MGSARKDCAVLRAACFCARVVPPVAPAAPLLGWEGEVGGGEAVGRREAKRLVRAEIEGEEGVADVLDEGCSLHGFGSWVWDCGCGDTAAGVLLLLPMPKPGTLMPAPPSLLIAEWLIPDGWACVAAAYVGGGLAAGSAAGCEFCLGGNLGGSFGFGFAAVLYPSVDALVGGNGSPSVFNPVLSALYGTGGGAGFGAASSCLVSRSAFACTSSAVRGAPKPRRSGVVELGRAAPPW